MRAIICSIITSALLVSNAFAQGFTRNIEINVFTKSDPAQAVGLVFSSSGAEQKLGPKLRRVSDELVIVTYPLNENNIQADTFGSALVILANGDVVLGEVKPLALRAEHSSAYSLPACVEPEDSSALKISEVGPLQRLVDFRTRRRTIAKDKLRLILSDEFVDKLGKLEQGFGLARESQLNADTHPLEIIDRATRLANAIRNYRERVSDKPAAKE